MGLNLHEQNLLRPEHIHTHKGNNMKNAFNTPGIPEVKFNKNGYEIRTDILSMAKDMLQTEHSTKFAGWEMSAKRDEKTGQIVTTVGMPEFPGLDKVLETAERMYAFVNSGASASKSSK